MFSVRSIYEEQCVCKSNVDLAGEPLPYIIGAIAAEVSFGFPPVLLEN